jgi:hypothetical protein
LYIDCRLAKKPLKNKGNIAVSTHMLNITKNKQIFLRKWTEMDTADKNSNTYQSSSDNSMEKKGAGNLPP